MLLRLLHPFIPFITRKSGSYSDRPPRHAELKSPAPASESNHARRLADERQQSIATTPPNLDFRQFLRCARRGERNPQPAKHSSQGACELQWCVVRPIRSRRWKELAPYFLSMANATLRGNRARQSSRRPSACASGAPAGLDVFVDLSDPASTPSAELRPPQQADREARRPDSRQGEEALQRKLHGPRPAEVVLKQRESLTQLKDLTRRRPGGALGRLPSLTFTKARGSEHQHAQLHCILYSCGTRVGYAGLWSRSSRSEAFPPSRSRDAGRRFGNWAQRLKDGDDVNELRDGMTPLYGAPTKEAAEVLIDAGANVNARTTERPSPVVFFVAATGVTPLCVAPSSEVATVLIEHGASVQALPIAKVISRSHYQAGWGRVEVPESAACQWRKSGCGCKRRNDSPHDCRRLWKKRRCQTAHQRWSMSVNRRDARGWDAPISCRAVSDVRIVCATLA